MTEKTFLCAWCRKPRALDQRVAATNNRPKCKDCAAKIMAPVRAA